MFAEEGQVAGRRSIQRVQQQAEYLRSLLQATISKGPKEDDLAAFAVRVRALVRTFVADARVFAVRVHLALAAKRLPEASAPVAIVRLAAIVRPWTPGQERLDPELSGGYADPKQMGRDRFSCLGDLSKMKRVSSVFRQGEGAEGHFERIGVDRVWEGPAEVGQSKWHSQHVIH